MDLRCACTGDLTFGDLAEFSVLDTRQYRSDQPCGDGNKPQCEDALEAEPDDDGRRAGTMVLTTD